MLNKSTRTRQHIIEKAAPFFNKKGYADTSLMNIVEATGLTKGAIYGHFDNKDDLAFKVFEFNLQQLNDGLNRYINNPEDAIGKLFAMIDFYRKEYKHIAERGGCPLLNASMEADDNFPALKVKVKAAIRQWKKTIVNLIEKAKEEKTVQRKTSAEHYASLFIAMIEGGVMLAKALDDPSKLYNILDHADQIIETELKM